MVINTTADLGIGLLLVVALAEFAKLRKKSERGWTWLGVAGVFLVFAGVPSLGGAALNVDLSIVQTIFAVLGWLFALIGAVFVGYESLLEK